MAGGQEFPAYLTLRTKSDGSAKATFLAEIDGVLNSAKSRFEGAFADIGRLTDRLATTFKRGDFKIDLGLSGLRQATADADYAYQKMVSLRDAATKLAQGTNDTSQATKSYLDALRAQTVEAKNARTAAYDQLQTYGRLQSAVDSLIDRNRALAESYRDTYREQARAENKAFYSQQAVNTGFAPGLVNKATNNGASFSALDEQAKATERLSLRLKEQDRITAELAGEMANLMRSINPTAAAQADFERATEQVNQAVRRGILTQEQAALAHARLRAELARGVGSMGALRQATLQAGQQVQDIGISLYSGQRASVVFAQQLPQLAFALSGLEGSANKTHDRVGRFATFLSGPWGLAVGLAVGVVAQLITSLFTTGEAADKGGSAMDKLSNKLDLSKNSYETLTAVVKEYNEAQAKSTALTYDAIIAAEDQARANLKVAKSELERYEAETLRAPRSANDQNQQYAVGAAKDARARIKTLEGQLAEANIAASTQRARVRTDPRAGIETAYDTQTVRVQEMRRKGEISERQLDLATTALAKARKDALKAYDDANRESKKRAKPEDARMEAFGNPLSPGSYRMGDGYGKKRGGNRVHGGIDLQTSVGSAVYATQDGNVTFAAGAGDYGNLIKLNHGAGTESRYAHLSRFAVGDGAAVKKGDVIGYSGGAKGAPGAGNSSGPHLHYEVWVNGKKVDPSKGQFPMDASKVEEQAEKAREALQQFGDRSAEKIQRINERFDEQPRLIDAAAAATRELDATIKELGERKPPGFQQMIADAQAAKAAVEDALVRPFRELEENSQKRIQSQRLIVMGRDEEAEALDIIWNLEERLVPLTENRKNQVRETVRHEREAMEALRGHKEIMDAYLGAVSSARSELEAILSGTGKIANFQTIFKQLRGKVLTELIFGPALRSLEEFTKKNVFGESVDKLAETTTYASDTVQDFADAVASAARQITASRSPSTAGALGGAASGLGSVYDDLIGGIANDNEIVVMGQKFGDRRGARPDLSPEQFIDQLSVSIVKPMLSGFDEIFGTTFFSKMGGALSGALSGFTTAGVPGGILGLLKGITKDGSKLDGIFGEALKGAQTGSLVSGIGGAFGIKLNETGSQIGGAIGKLIPIPGGDIIGAIAGGLIGNLFGKKKRGGASVSNDTVYAHANDSAVTDSLNGSGSSLQDAIKNIANAFGTTVGSYDVGLGRYKDYYQVSSSGSDPKLGNSYFGRDSKNSLYDGLDAEAAMRAAVLAALQDGAIQGIKAGAQKLLTSGKDLDVQIQKALDFQGVFDKLRAIKDPVGAALDALDKEFKRLRDIFTEAGASTEEYAQLEELYGMERAKAIKAAQDQITGSLRALYEQLTIGDSGLSLRSRLSSAQAAYDPLKARVAAGDVTAYDDFAAAAQTLLDLQRQIYGSQTPYFDLLAEITGLTKTQLDAQSAIANASAGRDSPFSPVSGGTAANDNTSVVGAIGTSNDILSQININIANLGNLLLTGTGGGGSSGFLPRNEAEYFF